ncbi:MAG TPA: SMP-30/gluconolactonase/LRE family protein [Acetobacteraceae bacterium]|jgi:gluconolactonase
MATLNDILETTHFEKLADGFVFTEGPLWHPAGFYYFVDVRASKLYRITLGQQPELIRQTDGGNGTTFDMQGRLINCEGDGRRLTVTDTNGNVATLIDRHDGNRLNRPNDVICRSDGTLFFTDPSLRRPVSERDVGEGAVYRIAPDGGSHLVAWCEYPNGLALSPDERTLYVANTRWTAYIHAIELDAAGNMVRRRVFADMSSDVKQGVPDGMKVDTAGRVFCTGPSGVWVFEPDGKLIGIIETPEVTANLAFGGSDLRTMFLTSSTSIHTLRVKTPGLPVPWCAKR